MSFLDDTKNFGLIMLILGLLTTISALVSIVDSFGNDMYDILLYIGSLIYGLMVLTFGYAVRTGKTLLFANLYDQGVDSKFGVLVTFITVLGAANLLEGIFVIANHFLASETLAAGAIGVVIGIILLIMAMFLKDGATTTMDKIIWIILAIIFILGIIGGLFAVIGAFALEGALAIVLGLLVGICTLLMFLMLFVYLISGEVKAKMGM